MLLGIDLSRRDVATILANSQGAAELALRADLPKEGGSPALWLAAMSAARETLHRSQTIPATVQCVALVLDAPLNEHGVIGKSPLAVGWENFDVPDALRQHLQIGRAVAENRIVAEALGEAQFGALRGVSGDWLYAHIGHTVNLVARVNGAILRGASGAAGDLGALCIEREGAVSPSGRRGGMDAYCTYENFLFRATGYGLTNQTPRQIWDAAGTNFAAKALCDDFTARLAQGLGAALALFNPARLVIGGGLAVALGDSLLTPLRMKINDFCRTAHTAGLVLEAGQLGNDAAALGAVALALQSLET